jgi:hypothetical protein
MTESQGQGVNAGAMERLPEIPHKQKKAGLSPGLSNLTVEKT